MIETTKFLLNRNEASGIRDRGCNLHPIPDDPIKKHQPVDIVRGHCGHFLYIEIVKCLSISFAFTKNRNPCQSCLRTFQYKKFE